MNRLLLTSAITLLVISLVAQGNNLSEQEVKVIKSYQFDITETSPILSEVSLDLPLLQLSQSAIKVDLLPVKLEDVTYSIKPLAHQTAHSKHYKGYASAGFGTAQILDLEASYRHQAPNYFMYGLDVEYSNIKDNAILSKERNNRRAGGFLKYYLKPTFWLEYQTAYDFTKAGVFGFNKESTSVSGGEIKVENYRRNYHEISLFKRLKKINTDINLKNTLFSARNTRMRQGENVINNNLIINTAISRSLQFKLNSSHKRQISTVNDSENSFLWNNRLSFSYLKPNLGVKLEGLASIGEEKKVLPEAEFYVKGNAHSLTAFYRNDLNINTFYTNQENINLIYIPSYSTSTSETRSFGLEYEFNIEGAHGLTLKGAHVNKKNDQIWLNSTEELQYFTFQLRDYSYYDLGIEYKINVLENLEFSQMLNYKLLDEVTPMDLPHFQQYNLKSSISYRLKKLSLTMNYILGDQVSFTQDIEGYANSSDYQHDLSLKLNYRISEAVNLSLQGIDILDNKFEAFTGYQDFGRRGKVSVKTKF